MGSISYHQKELEIALDPSDPRWILPELLPSERVILDVGCGTGQTLVALDHADRTCVGLDVDEQAVAYGTDHYGDAIRFVVADARKMPLPSNAFDLVISRVSLPYMDIPTVVGEMGRVLRTGGRVWLTFHTKRSVCEGIRRAIEARSVRTLVRKLYALANGYLLKYFGLLVPLADGSYESWQDQATLSRILGANGFDVVVSAVGRHTVVQGVLRA